MPDKFDIDAYRAARKSTNRHDSVVYEDIISALSNRENITLWKEGVISPNPETASEAYSHFHGFRNAMIDRASKEAAADDQRRFFANDIEEVLNPQAVQKYIDQVDLSENLDSKLESHAATFIKEQAAPILTARHSRPK